MPLVVPCARLSLSAGNVLQPYWSGGIVRYPAFEVYLAVGTHVQRINATGIDTRSDYVLFASWVAQALGLTLPFARQEAFSGAAGTQAGILSFPPDGLVSLFVTDYTEYCYLPAPLIAFHPPSSNPHLQRSVLGLTGFLQHFRFVLDYDLPTPSFELHPVTGFPGQTGVLPRGVPVPDFVRSLKTP